MTAWSRSLSARRAPRRRPAPHRLPTPSRHASTPPPATRPAASKTSRSRTFAHQLANLRWSTSFPSSAAKLHRLMHDAATLEWLRRRRDHGDAVVLHGYDHAAVNIDGRSSRHCPSMRRYCGSPPPTGCSKRSGSAPGCSPRPAGCFPGCSRSTTPGRISVVRRPHGGTRPALRYGAALASTPGGWWHQERAVAVPRARAGHRPNRAPGWTATGSHRCQRPHPLRPAPGGA